MLWTASLGCSVDFFISHNSVLVLFFFIIFHQSGRIMKYYIYADCKWQNNTTEAFVLQEITEAVYG